MVTENGAKITLQDWSLSLQGVLQQADTARREGDEERAKALITAAYTILDFGYARVPLDNP